MPTYELPQFLLLFLMPLTQNEYIVTDSLNFAEEICNLLIPYLLTVHWTKPLIFVLIVCIKMMRIPLRFLGCFS